jgi:hypothetical protein
MALVRDLMKPIYVFGQHDSPDEFVTEFKEARGAGNAYRVKQH